ncbi:MAG: hypothetical protein OEX07_01800 [Gammaproteobacteria bacterium]|nr:hypothetical protein [Gammaproteobacteria bacterium]
MKTDTRRSITTTLYIALSLIVPAALTLSTVKDPVSVIQTSSNPTPLGYTVSLTLFIFPMLLLAWWFLRHANLSMQKNAFWISVAVLVPAGILLDVLFGNSFFTFGNHNAVLGWTFPAVGGALPVEELVFYLTGFILVLLIYIWCDEYWLAAYNIPDYKNMTNDVTRILQFHPMSLVFGVLLIIAGVLYKNFISTGPGGIPWYYVYLVVVGLTPSSGLFPTVSKFINWRAYTFTSITIVLISLIWEVTLALVYQWWGFRPEVVIGFHINAWNNLPIEEVILWFAVSYTTIIIYEAVKIWKASQKPFRQAFMGKK